MSTTMSASPTPTATPARDAAQRLVGALQALGPTVPPSDVHRHVHSTATALREALAAGVRLPEILDALILATAPAVPEPPPAPPWDALLGLSLAAFAESGVGLGIKFPAHGVSIWMAGPETQARAIASERRLTMREIWRLPRMRQEAQAVGLDAETATVQQLVEALGGRVRAWRPAA
jgi:hypothetical protein